MKLISFNLDFQSVIITEHCFKSFAEALGLSLACFSAFQDFASFVMPFILLKDSTSFIASKHDPYESYLAD